MPPKLELRKPSLIKRVGERVGIREISPNDLCSSKTPREEFYRRYPDLWGDRTVIDTGLGGDCQSWRGDRGWWKRLT